MWQRGADGISKRLPTQDTWQNICITMQQNAVCKQFQRYCKSTPCWHYLKWKKVIGFKKAGYILKLLKYTTFVLSSQVLVWLDKNQHHINLVWSQKTEALRTLKSLDICRASCGSSSEQREEIFVHKYWLQYS